MDTSCRSDRLLQQWPKKAEREREGGGGGRVCALTLAPPPARYTPVMGSIAITIDNQS